MGIRSYSVDDPLRLVMDLLYGSHYTVDVSGGGPFCLLCGEVVKQIDPHMQAHCEELPKELRAVIALCPNKLLEDRWRDQLAALFPLSGKRSSDVKSISSRERR